MLHANVLHIFCIKLGVVVFSTEVPKINKTYHIEITP